MEQLTIFDVFQIDTGEHDIQTLPEEDMIRMVSEQTGIVFKEDKNAPQSKYTWYRATKGSNYIDVHYGHYFKDDRRFIGVSIGNNMGGSSCPCDSLKEAIDRIKRNMRVYGWNK